MNTAETLHHRSSLLAARLLIGAAVIAAAGVASAQSLPCDIYGAAGTACVAAHSTARALFAAYSGRLYQVRRASDGATADIATLAVGGYANAAAQDAFCAGTACTITIIYDQSPRGNHLPISPAGGNGGPDVGANAAALPAIAGGHKVYGVHVTPGVGYRNLAATGTARNGQAEGMYMVVVTRSAATGAMVLYVDGARQAGATGPTGPRAAAASLRVGSLQTNLNFFAGQIDEVRLFSVALTAAQVAALP